jgi:hypothetical protein
MGGSPHTPELQVGQLISEEGENSLAGPWLKNEERILLRFELEQLGQDSFDPSSPMD